MKCLIYGDGLEGRSAAKFLNSHNKNVLIKIVTDSDITSDFNWDIWDSIVVSPGVDRRLKIPAKYLNKTTSNTEIFFDLLSANKLQKVIGITGSKGKSTTAKFCAEVLAALGHKPCLAGNIGVPLLEILPAFQAEEYDYVVLELSSFQTEFLQKSPNNVLFTSFFPDHLDRHKTLQQYWQAKQNLWKHQTTDGQLFVPETLDQKINTNGKINYCQAVAENFIPPESVLQAAHLRQNLGLVQTLLKTLNVYNADIFQKSLKSFEMLEHRLEKVREISGVTFYNDSIATNTTATMAAIDYFAGSLGTLFLGGVNQAQEPFEPLFEKLKATAPQIKVVVFSGESAKEILQAASNTGFNSIQEETQLDQAVGYMLKASEPGQVALFSPACKSFDRFPSYAQRGADFKQKVFQL